MVLARLVAVLALVCVVARGASGLTLQGVRTPLGGPRSPLHPRLAPRDDLIPDGQALALMADPSTLRYEDAQLLDELGNPNAPASYRLQQLISELAEAAAAADSLEGATDGGPLPAEVADAVTEAEAAAVMAAAAGRTGGTWETPDPRYHMLINDYLSRVGGEENNNNNNRKARDSRNSRSVISNNSNNNSLTSSSAATTSTNNNNNLNNPSHMATTNNNNNMFKRAWPHNFSRRRSSGLSLSIDASMKVLREALYLEIARKKQRQQILRAQHNKALLSDIGKRDVASQLLEVEQQHGAGLDNGRN